MRNRRHVGLLVASGAVLALALAFVWTQGEGSSQAQEAAVRDCPSAGMWTIAVWTGADGTDPALALASCSDPPVAAAYWLDPQAQRWSRWFADLSIIPQPNGCSLFTGPIADQAALYGVISRMRDLGLVLISVHRVSREA